MLCRTSDNTSHTLWANALAFVGYCLAATPYILETPREIVPQMGREEYNKRTTRICISVKQIPEQN